MRTQVRIVRILTIVFAVWIASSLSACGKSNPATEPEGGYAAFRTAMLSRDADAVWMTLSDDTHQLFDGVLQTLRATEAMIEKLQPSDQADARAAIGAELLQRIEEPKQLFAYIFSSENVPVERGFEAGLQFKSMTLDGEDRAIVVTASGQEIEMVRDEDAFWRVRSPLHEQFAEAFSVMEANRSNLETAINLFGAAANEDAEISRLLGISAQTNTAE